MNFVEHAKKPGRRFANVSIPMHAANLLDQVLAVAIDLFAWRVVGWASSHRMRKELPLAALRRALLMRRPPKGLRTVW